MYNSSSNLEFLRRETVGLSSNPQYGGPPIFGCPRLLTRFIDNCLVYLVFHQLMHSYIFIKILSQAVTLIAHFTRTCFDPYGSSSGSTAGPC